jgi:hypothetical protein
MRLTGKVLESLVLPDGKIEAIFFDEDIPGYGCRLRAGGSRRAIFQYKLGNKQRRMVLGPPTAKTREAAKELYAKVRLGHDIEDCAHRSGKRRGGLGEVPRQRRRIKKRAPYWL